ncbi:hypothetical protein C8J57DRAFT_1508276 [Mycena rebaudengoi]|nr:hypothetical protein C8J57DRAFT_1508276 [Mycena rebaudengoi]
MAAPSKYGAQIILFPTDPSQNSGSSSSTIEFDFSTGTSPAVKPKERNTAQKRASHNAVERQRRDTLNARFVDLASLLPNLTNIKRPSKSSIVNSSIAHVRASRRHRTLASQELQLLHEECDSLRREVNGWRGRSGLATIPQYHRGDVFARLVEGAELDLDDADFDTGDGDYEEDVEALARIQLAHRRHLHQADAHPNCGEKDAFYGHGIDIPPPRSSSSISSESWLEDQTPPPNISHAITDTPRYMDARSRSRSQAHSYSQSQPSPEPSSSSGSARDDIYVHRRHHQPPHRESHDEWIFANETRHQMIDLQRQFIHHPSTY